MALDSCLHNLLTDHHHSRNSDVREIHHVNHLQRIGLIMLTSLHHLLLRGIKHFRLNVAILISLGMLPSLHLLPLLRRYELEYAADVTAAAAFVFP